MKQFKVMAAVAVAGLMMASCASENKEAVGNDGTKSVKIRVAYDQNQTRAEGAPVVHETVLTMAAGHIFFATPAGLIEKHVGIANSAGSEIVTLANLNDGEAVISDIPGAATKCYIISNEAAAGVTLTGDLKGQNISAVLGKVIAVNSLNDAGGAVANIPLYGVGNVTNVGGTTTGTQDYDASVEVKVNTLAARYQIAKISGKTYDYTDAGSNPQTVTIDDFTVEGIYINYFNESMTIGSTLGTLVDNGSTVANYATTGSTVYAAGEKGEKMADYLDLAATGAAAEPATAGNVWAYNLFPGTTVPHIVIKLSEVKFTDSANSVQTTMADQFITVGEFKYASGHTNAGTVVSALAANNIYTFSDIQFDYTKLSSVPETAEKIDVLVTVDMMKWLDNGVEWSN